MEKHSSDNQELQRCIEKLHFGSWEDKEVAAKVIERLAKDGKVREFIIELWVAPLLVSMAASEVVSCRRVGVKALIQLANGACKNKALIVDAGILSKLPKRIDLEHGPTISEFVDFLSSLSSLANTQFHHASSLFLPFLRDTLNSCSSTFDTEKSCLRALYNVSTMLENAGALVSNGIVPILLELSSIKETSEQALTILGNLVVTLEHLQWEVFN